MITEWWKLWNEAVFRAIAATDDMDMRNFLRGMLF